MLTHIVDVSACFVCSTIGYIVVGLLGAWSYPNAPDNILRKLVSGSSTLFTRVCATLFALFIIGLGIPGEAKPPLLPPQAPLTLVHGLCLCWVVFLVLATQCFAS